MSDEVIARLESIIATEVNPDRQAKAYAALTLAHVLAPEWKHVVTVKDGKTVKHETVVRAAGMTFGPRDGLERRLATYLAELQ